MDIQNPNWERTNENFDELLSNIMA